MYSLVTRRPDAEWRGYRGDDVSHDSDEEQVRFPAEKAKVSIQPPQIQGLTKIPSYPQSYMVFSTCVVTYVWVYVLHVCV